MLVPRATVILDGSPHPGVPRKPWNRESGAACAVSLTTVPTVKKALQAPEPLPLVIWQSMPAGCEVTRPLPLPPGRIEMLPCVKWNSSQTVMIPCFSVLKTPPTVPMITADWALVTWLVVIGKLARVAPAVTVVWTLRPPPRGGPESPHGACNLLLQVQQKVAAGADG